MVLPVWSASVSFGLRLRLSSASFKAVVKVFLSLLQELDLLRSISMLTRSSRSPPALVMAPMRLGQDAKVRHSASTCRGY